MPASVVLRPVLNERDRRLFTFYEIYVPTNSHLETLINSFVDSDDSIQIGRLRYTETETLGRARDVEVRVSPQDFVANRTALFGKTRMGKSNTIKVILETMLNTADNLGQIVFDLSGEYTYPDPQTDGSLFLRYQQQCSRYSLKPRHPEVERAAGAPRPRVLRVNFHRQIELGHAIINALFTDRRPDYMAPFFGWEPVDVDKIGSTGSQIMVIERDTAEPYRCTEPSSTRLDSRRGGNLQG